MEQDLGSAANSLPALVNLSAGVAAPLHAAIVAAGSIAKADR